MARERDVSYLPGAQTVSEVAHHARQGLNAVKLFPASIAGGQAAIRAFSSVPPGMMFCPTGGVDAETAGDYLALDSVPCVGGSWLASAEEIAARDGTRITDQAAVAARFRRGEGQTSGEVPIPVLRLSMKRG